MSITVAMRTQVSQLYVSLFGRAPDGEGLGYWVGQLAGGKTVAQVAQDMFNVTAARAYYPSFMTNDEIVAAFYVNVLGRTADAEGQAYWVGQMNKAGATKGSVIADMINAVVNYTGTDAAGVKSKALFNNKVEVAQYYGEKNGTVAGATAALAGVTEVAATVTAGKAAVDAGANPGQTFTLTKGIDSVSGTTGNDTINAVLDGGESTLTALDVIDGGAGTDTLNLNALVAVTALPSVTISNVETINVRAAANVGTVGVNDLVNDATDDNDATPSAAVDFSAISGLNTLNVTQATAAAIKAATTTDVAVSGVTGGIEINGGKTVTVTDAADGNNITVGSIVANAAANANSAGTAAAGAITVTDTKQNAGVIQVDGGTTVTVTTTSTVDSGATIIGATKAATGAVAVTANLNGDGTATLDQGDIVVTGGSTVTVNSNLTITAKDQTASAAHTFGDVRVNSDGKTTSVVINQNYVETEFTKAKVDAIKETSVVTFSAMTSGQTLTFNGLTFTASKNLTAAEVAAAFSNLTAADTQSSQGPVANGVYTGTFNTAVWTSGAASGATVTFTAQDDDETDLSFTGTATAPTQVKTAGTAGSAAVTSNNTVTYGAVRVDGAATESITTLTINGYGSADLGDTSANDLNALTALSLANSGGTATLDTSAGTLALTVNKVNHGVDFSGAASLKTLNVTATGANSTFGLNAAAVETLTVAGDKVLDIDTGSTLTALKTVTVTGTAGLSIDMTGLANQTSVNTTGTTGTVTAIIDASKATYTGGAGSDNVTLTSTTVSKAINLGAGDDKVTLASGTTSLTESIIAGEGTDTLVMAAADAETASATTTFETKIDGFEKLSLGNAADSQADTINLANLDDIAYVITGTSQKVRAVTITGATDNAGDTVSLVVNGTTYTTAAAIYADGTAIAAALATAINNNNGLSATAAAGVLTIVTTGDRHVNVGAISTTTGGGAADTAAISATATNTRGYVLNNLAAASTIEITGDSQVTAALADASGGADVINVIHTNLNGSGNTYADLIVGNVETVNILVQDGDNTGPDTHSLLLEASAVTKVTIGTQDGTAVDADGNKDLTNYTLEIKGATGVTIVDASNFIGVFTYTADDGVTTVTGGSGNDVLTASGSGDTLIGGAGNDTLKGDILSKLYGGEGKDIFMMNTPTNVNSYSSIMDLSAGDVIDLDAVNAGTVVFVKAAITLAATAVFQDYANAAANALGTDSNDAAWFQFQGNTYIVKSGNGVANNDFVNGQDSIIQIVGLVDLSTASYNQSIGTLEIA